ncbi:MAG: hypothetical protein QXL96_08890 [Ignisphaera sp.]
MFIIISNENEYEIYEIIKSLCKNIGILCYELADIESSLLSLTWIETIQYIDNDCLNDFEYIENILRSFGYTLNVVINHRYDFMLNIDSIVEKIPK